MYFTFVVKRIWNNSQYSDYATEWTIRFSNPGVGKTFYSFPRPPNRFWNLHSLLFSGHTNFFPKGQSDRVVNLTTYLHMEPRWRLTGAHPRCRRGLDRDSFICLYVVGRLSSRTHHRVLAVAALGKSLSMVWRPWHISVSQLCCCWSMAVCFWVASITVCVCFGVPPRECRSLN